MMGERCSSVIWDGVWEFLGICTPRDLRVGGRRFSINDSFGGGTTYDDVTVPEDSGVFDLDIVHKSPKGRIKVTNVNLTRQQSVDVQISCKRLLTHLLFLQPDLGMGRAEWKGRYRCGGVATADAVDSGGRLWSKPPVQCSSCTSPTRSCFLYL